MKKLGKKRSANAETIQAYACLCTFCACKSCANASVTSMLYSGAQSQTSGTIMLVNS